MSDLRHTILKIIKDNPGIRYRELLRSLGTINGVLSYHLYMLEYNQVIKVERKGGMTRYYPRDIDEKEARVLGMLRIPMVRRIVELMLADGKCSLDDIASHIDRSKSTILWHMKRLTDEGIVVKDGNLYYLKDRDIVSYTLAKYKGKLDSIDKIDVIADNYTEMMDEFRL